jgi:hypothetical protein
MRKSGFTDQQIVAIIWTASSARAEQRAQIYPERSQNRWRQARTKLTPAGRLPEQSRPLCEEEQREFCLFHHQPVIQIFGQSQPQPTRTNARAGLTTR